MTKEKYALLDTDFISKTHLIRKDDQNKMIDRVMELPEYRFYCHEQIRTELARHDIGDSSEWLETKISDGSVHCISDEEIIDELSASAAATSAASAPASTAASTVATPAAAPEVIDFSKVKIEPLFEEQVHFETFSKSDFRAVKVKDCVAVPKSKKLLQFTLDDGTGTDRTILSGIHAYYEPEELIGKTLIAITNLPPRAMMGIESCGMLLSAVHEEEGEEKLHLLMVDNHIPAGAKLY